MKTIIQQLIPCILYVTVKCQTLTCESGLQLRKVGCYGDFKSPVKRAMKELLLTDRDKTSKRYSGQSIDWNNWGTYLPNFSCRCALAAKEKGYDFLGIQFYGECWSSSDAADRYNLYGTRDNCVTSLFNMFNSTNTDFEICSDSDSLACTGGQFSNYVYEIVSATGDGFTPWVEGCCSKSCGTEIKNWTKSCPKPLPSKPCEGTTEKTQLCNTNPCPIDGKYTPWVEDCCSQTCGGGVKKWTRTCTNPPPQYGGKPCEGLTEKTELCNTSPCDSYSSTEGSATGVAK